MIAGVCNSGARFQILAESEYHAMPCVVIVAEEAKRLKEEKAKAEALEKHEESEKRKEDASAAH